MPRIAARLAELGIELPGAKSPAFNYVPFVAAGDLVFISGQLPWAGERIEHTGQLGGALTVADGRAAARLCAIQMLAQLRDACAGDLDRVVRCVKLGGWVSCTATFAEHPAVVDAASELIVQVFGDAGRHARFAVGAPSLPRNVPVELEGVFQLAEAARA